MLNHNVRRTVSFSLILLFVVIITNCMLWDDDQEKNQLYGSVSGRAVFTDSSIGNEGIAITLESSNGLLSSYVYEVNQSIYEGAMNISTHTNLYNTQTVGDGSFKLNNIPVGNYILYAVSQDSLEKAITRNIIVTANQDYNITEILNLTPVGSISGQISVQSGSKIGFLISVAGTSFMAVTDSDGRFTISGIPAKNGYSFLVMRGNYMGVYSEQLVNIQKGVNPPLEIRDISNAELLNDTIVYIGGNGNWYVNDVDTGILAQGKQGEQGESGNDGYTPYIGSNGNWWIDTNDTGISAQGKQGEQGESGNDGYTPYIGSNGNWWIDTNDTGIAAKWPQGETVYFSLDGESFEERLRWLKTNAKNNTQYRFVIIGDININPQTLLYPDKNNVTIRVIGIGSENIISLIGNGSIFTVGSGVTLILDSGVTLQGHSNNNASLVTVSGTLIMCNGSKISGNNRNDYHSTGGGVFVMQNGNFIMEGGEIVNNTASSSSFAGSSRGGGVYIAGNGVFTMKNGKIINNNVTSSFTVSSYGGGVYIAGNFTMKNGKIINNNSDTGGGGVATYSGIFTLEGGVISNNTAEEGGGYWAQGTEAVFTMVNGLIYNNTAREGGGVNVSNNKNFIMKGGLISGNIATSSGGGVLVSQIGHFTMEGGVISGNTVLLNEVDSSLRQFGGGGVCIMFINSHSEDRFIGTFIKTGGIITGYTPFDLNSNVVKDINENIIENYGHAISSIYWFNRYDLRKRRESTAGLSINLSLSIDGATGDWEN